MKRNFNFIRVKVILLLWLAASLAFAAPEHGEVIEGSANITQNANLTTITQHSDQALIEWQTFDIEQAETVEFVQPDSQSLIINNIVGGDTSYIMGELTANGQVVLINQQGFVFTGGSFIQADSLTIAAADLLKDESGNWLLQSTSDHAQILNAGKIEVQNGHLLLMANQIINTGDMINHFGDITAIADQGGFYGLDPTGLTYLALPNEMTNNQATLIDQSGNMHAENGSIDLKVISRNDALDAMLNHQGTSTAGLMDSNEGEMIHFEADNIVIQNEVMADQINILSKYSLSTNDAKIGFKSSRIELNADSIHIKNSQINAANTHKPGSIKIGGMHLSSDKQASKVIIDRHSILDVSAQNQGNGGDAVVWSKQGTHFTGKIYATGGSQSGDGGFVEISAKQNLHFDGHVDTRAENGNWGTLLLDPDIIIITDGSGGADDAQISGDGATLANEDAMSTYTISEQALEAASATSNISLYATHSIIINDLSDDTLSLAQTGTVTLNVNNSDNTKDNGSAYITMLDKNDTIELTGSGDLEIQASGRTTNLGEVSVDIGNINKLSTGNILITADQIDDGADDNVGRMIISTGDIDVASGGIVFRSDNNDSNVGSQSVDVTVGDLTVTAAVQIHLNSHDAINLSTQTFTSTLNAGDALQPLLTSGTSEARYTMNGNFTSSGGNLNLNTDYLILGSDVLLDAGSGSLNLSGISTSLDGQNNNFTINTAASTSLLIDWADVTNVNELHLYGQVDYSFGNTFVGGALNFNQTNYDKLALSSSTIKLETTENFTSTNLDSNNTNLIVLFDTDQTGDLISVTDFDSNNGDITFNINENTTLTNINITNGDLTLSNIDNTKSVGVGSSLGAHDLIFDNATINSWAAQNVVMQNASQYTFNNVTHTSNFVIGDGTQAVSFQSLGNTVNGLDVNASQVNIFGQVTTTSNDLNLISTGGLSLNDDLTSADDILLSVSTFVGLGSQSTFTAVNNIDTQNAGIYGSDDLVFIGGSSMDLGVVSIGTANLTINLDQNAGYINNKVHLRNGITAGAVIIESHGMSATTPDDYFIANSTITANSLSVTNFESLELRGDLIIIGDIEFDAFDFSFDGDIQASELSISSLDPVIADRNNIQIISDSIITVDDLIINTGIQSSNDLEINIQNPTADVTLENIEVTGADLTIAVDNFGLTLDQVGATNINLSNNNTGDLFLNSITDGSQISITNFNNIDILEALNLAGLDMTFNNVLSLQNDITLASDFIINSGQVEVDADSSITANNIELINVVSNNDSNLILNATGDVSASMINLGTGNIEVHLDKDALSVSNFDMNGAITAGSILIDSHSVTSGTVNDSVLFAGAISANQITVNDILNIDLQNDLIVSGDIALNNSAVSISNNTIIDGASVIVGDITSVNDSSVQINSLGDIILSNVNIGAGDLTIDLDPNALIESTLHLQGSVDANSLLIEAQNLNALANNDHLIIDGNIQVNDLSVTGFTDIDIGADITSVTNLDLLDANLIITEDVILTSEIMELSNITTSNDSNLTLIVDKDLDLNNVNLDLGNLNVNIDNTGTRASTVNLDGQIDANIVSFVAHENSMNVPTDIFNQNSNINANDLSITQFGSLNLKADMNVANDALYSSEQINIINNIQIDASNLTMDNLVSSNNSNITLNINEVLTLEEVSIGTGNVIINIDSNAESIGHANLNGAITAGDITISAQDQITSTLNDSVIISGQIDANNLTLNDFANTIMNGEINLNGNLDIDTLSSQLGANITANEFIHTSQDSSEITISNDVVINVNDFSKDSLITGNSDLTLNILNPSGAVNLDDIILINGDLTLQIQNTSDVSVENIGADNIEINNNNTADLNVGSVVDQSQLDIDGFNNVTFTDDLILAAIDVDAINDIIQSDGSKVEVNDGILNWNAGDDIYITQIVSNNSDADTVNIDAGNSLVDVNDTQIDFIVENSEVLNITVSGGVPSNLDDFVIEYTEAVIPEISIPDIDIIQDLVEGVLTQPNKDIDESQEVVEKTNEVRVSKLEKSLDAQFEQCDDKEKQCKKEKAVKTFLGRLLIGGELPNQ
ncbi:filamentous hemagglutinin N-terminal domain-containing protein [Marinicellulosiphila megalodicopiae]|uniref:two-partner secretion domain-containing protein n=1 Tax=Marinicellulosiphila megalodicopiae TaxID=2724896 RepID=UPI003BB1D23B